MNSFVTLFYLKKHLGLPLSDLSTAAVHGRNLHSVWGVSRSQQELYNGKEKIESRSGRLHSLSCLQTYKRRLSGRVINQSHPLIINQSHILYS